MVEYRSSLVLDESQFVIVLTSEFVHGSFGDDGIGTLYTCEFKQHVHAAWEAHRFPYWLMPHFQHIADKLNMTCHSYDLLTRTKEV